MGRDCGGAARAHAVRSGGWIGPSLEKEDPIFVEGARYHHPAGAIQRYKFTAAMESLKAFLLPRGTR